jgi:hypothetical protein
MSPKPRRLFRAGSVLLAVTLLAAVTATVALGAVQRRASTTIDPQEMGSATAQCRSGQVALAAGFEAPDVNLSQGGPAARLTSKFAGRDGVKTEGFNFNDTQARELDSFAYCGNRTHAPKANSAHVDIAPGSGDTVTAECPSGSKAISGGFGTDGRIVTLTSKRSGKTGWKVIGVNIDDSSSNPSEARLFAYVYCATPGPGLGTKSSDATVGGTPTAAKVKCPAGETTVSGGFDGNLESSNGQLSAAGALTSKRLDHARGWTTTSLSIDSSRQATITTYAYCRG